MAVRRSGDPRRLDPLSGRFTDYIVIDTETTGLSVRKGAKLIEIGAVKIHNDELVDEFDQLLNPVRTCSFKNHGFDWHQRWHAARQTGRTRSHG